MDLKNINTRRLSKSCFPSGYADHEAALDWAGRDLFGSERWDRFQSTTARRLIRWSPSLGGNGTPGGEMLRPIDGRTLFRREFKAAENHLRSQCTDVDGAIRVVVLHPDGDQHPRPTYWRSEAAGRELRKGKTKDGHNLGFILPDAPQQIEFVDPALSDTWNYAQVTAWGRMRRREWVRDAAVVNDNGVALEFMLQENKLICHLSWGDAQEAILDAMREERADESACRPQLRCTCWNGKEWQVLSPAQCQDLSHAGFGGGTVFFMAESVPTGYVDPHFDRREVLEVFPDAFGEFATAPASPPPIDQICYGVPKAAYASDDDDVAAAQPVPRHNPRNAGRKKRTEWEDANGDAKIRAELSKYDCGKPLPHGTQSKLIRMALEWKEVKEAKEDGMSWKWARDRIVPLIKEWEEQGIVKN